MPAHNSIIDANRLAQLLCIQGMTQAAAAQELQVTPGAVSLYTRRPNYTQAVADVWAQTEEAQLIQVSGSSVVRRMKRLEFMYKLGAKALNTDLMILTLDKMRLEMAQIPGHARRIARAKEDGAPGSTLDSSGPTFNVIVTNWKPGDDAKELPDGELARLIQTDKLDSGENKVGGHPEEDSTL